MAEFNMKLTQGGAVLLAKAQAEKELKFKYIALGKGVFEGNPEDATALVSKVIDLNIQEKTNKDTMAILKGTLTYNNVPDGFTWTELGIIAIDPDNQAEVLYMYGYSQFGDIIPPSTSATQIEKVIQVATYVGNAQNVTTVIDESLINIPKSDINQPNGVAGLNQDGVLDIIYGGTGAKTAQEAIYNLGCMPRKNLLDNWHLAGPGSQTGDSIFPINQQTETDYNGKSPLYTIDRWQVNLNATVTLTSNALVVQNNATKYGGIYQKTPVLYVNSGEKYMFSVLADEVYDDGWYIDTHFLLVSDDTKIDATMTILQPFTTGKNQIAIGAFTIPDGYINTKLYAKNFICNNTNAASKIGLIAAKLEKGENQTLAWQDTDQNWHLFEKPDYMTELAKCRQYYEKTAFATCYGVANSENEITSTSSIFFIAEKNANGTVTVNDNPSQVLQVTECDTLKPISDAVLEVPVIRNKRMLSPKINSPSGAFTVGKMYRIQVPDNAYIVDASI